MVTYLQQAFFVLTIPFISLSSLRPHEPLLTVAQQTFPGMIESIAVSHVRRQELAQSLPPALAQVTSPVAEGSGRQLVINGRAIAAPWVISAGQLFIEESGVTQGLGVELLTTLDHSRQPVLWFTPPGEALVQVSTLLGPSYRLLDMTSLAAAANWQWSTENGVLQISTPVAQVTGVRQSSQTWGDRVVIDLDQATPWQLQKNDSELVIALDGTVRPEGLPSVTLQPGSRVTSIQVQPSGTQTLIKIAKPATLHAQVGTLATPNRIVIDLQASSTKEFSIHWAPGLWWHQKIVNCGEAQCPVTALELVPEEPTLKIRPIWSNAATIEGTTPLRSMAEQWQAIASINGGFFNRNNQLPLGAIRHSDEWISGPILNRGAIAWTVDGQFTLGRLSLQETLTTEDGTAIALKHLNSGYVQAGVSRYTPSWGATYSTLTDYETIVTIQNQQVTRQQVIEKAGQTRVPIPHDGYILAVRSNNSVLGALSVGTQVAIETVTLPAEFADYSDIVGAGPLLLQNRQLVLNAQSEQFSDAFIQQRAARSAIGITDENHVLLVIAQRERGGSGLTLTQMAQVMQSLGATDALNLDGGSSTTLTLGNRVLNDVPAAVARVNNGIGIFFNTEPHP